MYSITLLTNNSCNLNCIYCYENNKQNNDIDKQSCDAFFNLLKKNIIFRFFQIIGGEPTLSSNFDYLLNKLYELNSSYEIGILLNTNGTIYKKIDKNRIYDPLIQISIDPKEHHMKYRGGDYNIILSNIYKYIEDGLFVRTHSVVYNPFVFEKDIDSFVSDILHYNNIRKPNIQYYIFSKRNILKDIIYYIKYCTMVKKYPLFEIKDNIESIACDACKNQISFDLTTGKTIYCHHICTSSVFKYDNFVIGDINVKFINEDILNEFIYLTDKYNYNIEIIKSKKLTRYIIDNILKDVICPINNYYSTGKLYTIGKRQLLYSIISNMILNKR